MARGPHCRRTGRANRGLPRPDGRPAIGGATPRPSAMLTVRERRTISSSGSAGPVGERRSSGLQIRLRRFESGPGLQKRWRAAENQVNASGSTEPGASLPRSRVPSPARPAIPAETGNQARHVCMRPQARRVANRVAARSVHAPANEIRFSRTRQDRRRTNAIGRRNRFPTALFRRMAALEIGSKWRCVRSGPKSPAARAPRYGRFRARPFRPHVPEVPGALLRDAALDARDHPAVSRGGRAADFPSTGKERLERGTLTALPTVTLPERSRSDAPT